MEKIQEEYNEKNDLSNDRNKNQNKHPIHTENMFSELNELNTLNYKKNKTNFLNSGNVLENKKTSDENIHNIIEDNKINLEQNFQEEKNKFTNSHRDITTTVPIIRENKDIEKSSKPNFNYYELEKLKNLNFENNENKKINFISDKSNINSRKFFINLLIIYNIFYSIILFLFPSLSILISYCVFTESFNPREKKIPVAMVIIYGLLLVLTGFFSIIGNPKQLKRFYFVLSFLFSFYYIFFIICSFISLNNIVYNRDFQTNYVLNFNFFGILLGLNILFLISPIFFNFKEFFQFKNLRCLLANFICIPNYTTVYLIYAIFNIFKIKNKEDNSKNKNAFLLLFFFLSNVLISFICFALEFRKMKVNCIVTITIFCTVLNFIKSFFVIYNQISFHFHIRKNVDLTTNKILEFMEKYYYRKVENKNKGKNLI